MPRVTREQTEKNRSMIEDASARLFREQGLDAVSVANLMASVGLTHGGFYRHFRSKDDLVAEALASGLAREGAPGTVPQTFDAYVTWYLSAGHRDDPGQGCMMAALGCDAARGGAGMRRRFTDAVRAQFGRFGRWFGAGTEAEARARAITAVSAIVGAVMLARAVDDPQLSDEILAVVRARLLDLGA